MKNATRILIPSLSLGLLLKTIVVSHAIAFTLYVNTDPTNPVPSRNYETQGAFTSTGAVVYRNFFTPSNADNAFSASYSTPSVVNFGTTLTTAGNPTFANTSTFDGGPNSTVNFTFSLQNGSHSGGADTVPLATDDAFDRFVVTGSLSGTVGYSIPGSGTSTTKLTLTSVQNLDAGAGQVFATPNVINPNNGLLSLYINAVVGTQSYDVYLNEIQDINAPGKTETSVSGFITTSAVPEPGSMALLLGLGVTGTALLRRRKK